MYYIRQVKSSQIKLIQIVLRKARRFSSSRTSSKIVAESKTSFINGITRQMLLPLLLLECLLT